MSCRIVSACRFHRPPGCTSVRHGQQHHRGEILDLLQPEVVGTQPRLACIPVEQMLRPSGRVLTEHHLSALPPVGGQVGQ